MSFNFDERCPFPDDPTLWVDFSGNIYDTEAQCVVKQHIDKLSNGYRYKRIWIRDNGKLKYYRVHRMVARCFLPPEDAERVDLKSRNTLDTHVDNLRSAADGRDNHNSKGNRTVWPALPKYVSLSVKSRLSWRVQFKKGDRGTRLYSKHFPLDQLYEAYLDAQRMKLILHKDYASDAYFKDNSAL